jgi:hypothetical protein
VEKWFEIISFHKPLNLLKWPYKWIILCWYFIEFVVLLQIENLGLVPQWKIVLHRTLWYICMKYQRVVWTINITLCPLSSLLFSTVNFYISIFFSKFTGPMEIKLGRNVHWMVPYRFYGVLFCSDWKFIMAAWANNAFWLVKIRKNLFRNHLADFIVIVKVYCRKQQRW